jgi:hypothetical protein
MKLRFLLALLLPVVQAIAIDDYKHGPLSSPLPDAPQGELINFTNFTSKVTGGFTCPLNTRLRSPPV